MAGEGANVMTVRELIERLQALPPGLEVWLDGSTVGDFDRVAAAPRVRDLTCNHCEEGARPHEGWHEGYVGRTAPFVVIEGAD